MRALVFSAILVGTLLVLDMVALDGAITKFAQATGSDVYNKARLEIWRIKFQYSH
jgi:hypothetical protein